MASLRVFFPVAVAAASVFAAGFYIDQNVRYAHRIDLRSKATAVADKMAKKFQQAIDADLRPLRELDRSIAANSFMSKEDFRLASEKIFKTNPAILQFSAIRENRVHMEIRRDGGNPISPPQNSIPSLEMPFLPGGTLLDATRMSNVFWISHNRWGIYATVPVFRLDGVKVERWGLISAVIDADRLFARSGLSYDGDGHFHFAIRAQNSAPSAFKPFFRADQVATIFGSDPVITHVTALNSQWQIGVGPYGGWDAPPEYLGLVRTIIIIFALLLLIPLAVSARIRLERHQNVAALKERERELEIVSRRLNLALESYRCGVWESAIGVEETYWDERMHELHGSDPARDIPTRKTWLQHVHPDEREKARNALEEVVENGGNFSFQCRIVLSNGLCRHIRYVAQIHETTEGLRLFGMAIDVSEDVRLTEALLSTKTDSEAKNLELQRALGELSARENELQETSRRLTMAMEAYECGIWEADLETDETFWDDRMFELFGVNNVNGIIDAQVWENAIHPEDRKVVSTAIQKTLEAGARYNITYRILRKTAEVRHLHTVGQRYISPEGHTKFIGIALDVTNDVLRNDALIAAKNEAEAKTAELEATKERIEYNAMHDPLTGLANRRTLDDELDRLANCGREDGQRLTLLHIDLDRFKEINDTLGHAAGDAMLTHAAKVLRENTRSKDLVARIGGDEFVVLINNTAPNKDIARMAQRIIDQMNQPVLYEGHECRFGVSIGIAREQSRRSSVRKLLVNADIALYRAKAHGRNRAEFFTASLQAEIRHTKKLADDILRGLENDQFEPWYQPQFCAETHQLTGVEALVRWNHPERGMLTPDAFLKVAEEINAVATLDRIVLERALIDRLRWATDGILVPKISVNVSARRLRDDQLIKALKDLSISKGQISFELLESIFLDDDDEVIIRNIKRIKALGIDIEIDDFGTGHTSIVSLLKLEPKRLKIDRQLVSPMLTSAREHSLVRSIIEIGSSLDIETVAEGVESMDHAMKLREMGCNTLQGYAFSRPIPAKDLCGFVNDFKARMAS